MVSKLVNTLSSFGLTCLILMGLFVLTFAGTWAQIDEGLYEVQKRYFDSFYLIFELGWLRVPFPGGQLLLSLLFINLVVGGIVRIKKSNSRIGILTTHVGILMLLSGGFIEYYFSHEGSMALFEGDQSSEYRSYHHWEIAVIEDLGGGEFEEHLIPYNQFVSSNLAREVTFSSGSLPFDLVVSGYLPNCSVVAAGHGSTDPKGFRLRSKRRNMKTELDLAGHQLVLREKESGKIHETILWSGSRYPYVVEISGRTWGVELRKQLWRLPFEVHLDKFIRVLHPRTGMAKSFESEITKISGDDSQKIKISMNEPLRHEGYVMYQESWGPEGAGPDDRLFSQFAVSRNPADQWPLYACLVIVVGLLLHFSLKLLRYIRAEARAQA